MLNEDFREFIELLSANQVRSLVDGGVKHSSLSREQGMAVLEHYSEYKSVFIGAE